MRIHWLIPALLTTIAAYLATDSQNPRAIVVTEFIYETAPFPSCHASTIAETKDGVIAAWFGGKHENSPDVGIWVSRRNERGWSPVVEVANGIQDNGTRFPCWNPVLFQPTGGPLLLFFKVGPSPSEWWGMLMTSTDSGRTWSTPQRLPARRAGTYQEQAGPTERWLTSLPFQHGKCGLASAHGAYG
jgi:predicted neuraminidase